jgi:glycerol dehydrogenase
MKRTIIAPGKYVQGPNVLAEIGSFLKELGSRPLILWDETLKGIVGPTVQDSIQAAGLEMHETLFQGEATQEERQRVAALAGEKGADISVGIGGGKVLDVAKAAAVDQNIAMVTVPTIASNDSPTSAASVWYDENHNFVNFVCWPRNPNLVLVDSKVIAHGPVRSFVAGMGDALATWIETAAAFQTRALNLAGGMQTLAAKSLAELCFETLMEYGIRAKKEVELNLVTPAVEKVIEANVLLSGLGFESGGLATAHMIGNILSNFQECQEAGLMHGEKVAFGVLSQLCLDDEIEMEGLEEVLDFMIEVGLPVTFQELNLKDASRQQLQPIADVCLSEASLCHNHPFPFTGDSILDAMFSADALGREQKQLFD